MKRLVIFCACIAASTASMAITGNQAIDSMTGSPQKDNYLLAYTSALFDQELALRMNTNQLVIHKLDVPIWPFCPPPGANAVQGAAVLRNALFGDPANNHQELIVIARTAFKKVGECSPEQIAP